MGEQMRALLASVGVVVLAALSGCGTDEGDVGGGEQKTPQAPLAERLSGAQVAGQQVEFTRTEVAGAEGLDVSVEPDECLPLLFPVATLADAEGADVAEAHLEGLEDGVAVIITAATVDEATGASLLEEFDGRVDPCAGEIRVEVNDGDEEGAGTVVWEDSAEDRRAWSLDEAGETARSSYVVAAQASAVVVITMSSADGTGDEDLDAIADDVLSAVDAA